IECGRPILEGKWYPGSFKWQEVRGRDGAAGKQTVSDIDRGTPIDVKFTGPPPSIVRVVVLQNQTSQYAVGHPNFPYPFQKGVDNTGDALRYRNLYVYGTNLPRNRDQKIVVTSDDPNIEYLVEAVQRDREITPGLSTKFEQGLQLALLAYPPSLHAKVRAMDAVLLRAELKRGTAGLLPGIKSFRLNDVPGSWELRFGDDGARVAFARPAYASSDPPTALREDEVQPT